MTSVLIVGVGGQGTLLASRILGQAVGKEGFDVKVSEVHGMSQRGGSVVTYVRFGEKIHSPVIELGEADLILAFEQLEAARYLPYLKPGGSMVVNTQRIDPMPVITGAVSYPAGLLSDIRDKGIRMTAVDALALAREAGSPKAVNVVLIGAMARQMDFPKKTWTDAVAQTVPERFLAMNQKAFERGYNVPLSE